VGLRSLSSLCKFGVFSVVWGILWYFRYFVVLCVFCGVVWRLRLLCFCFWFCVVSILPETAVWVVCVFGFAFGCLGVLRYLDILWVGCLGVVQDFVFLGIIVVY